MKKFITLLLVIVMAIICCSCQVVKKSGGGGGGGDDPTPVPPTPDPYAWMGSEVHSVPSTIRQDSVNFIPDDKYQHGINFLGSIVEGYTPGRGYGDFDGLARITGDQQRYWTLAQWNSKQILGVKDNGKAACKINYSRVGNDFIYENDAKKVVINPVTGACTLRVNGGFEYGYQERSKSMCDNGEWVHLLIQPAYEKHTVKQTKEAVAYADFSVDEIHDYNVATPTLGKGAQAAQFVWYGHLCTEKYVNSRESFKYRYTKDDGTYEVRTEAQFQKETDQKEKMRYMLMDNVWFGIPLYDNREENDPWVYGECLTIDTGTSIGIYSVDKSDYFKTQPKAGHRYQITVPLDKAIKFAYEELKKQSVFSADSTYENSYLTMSNIGWEVPGTIDCQITLHQFGIYYSVK